MHIPWKLEHVPELIILLPSIRTKNKTDFLYVSDKFKGLHYSYTNVL